MDIDAGASEGGEWGDLTDEDIDSSSGDEGSSSDEDASTMVTPGESSTQQDESSVSFMTGARTSFSTANSDSTSSTSSDDDDGSESGLFGDSSLSIPPRLQVPQRKVQHPPTKVSEDASCAPHARILFQGVTLLLSGVMRSHEPCDPGLMMMVQRSGPCRAQSMRMCGGNDAMQGLAGHNASCSSGSLGSALVCAGCEGHSWDGLSNQAHVCLT